MIHFSKIDRVYRYYSTDLALRAAVVITTKASRQICSQLETTPSATVGLSRALTGAAQDLVRLDPSMAQYMYEFGE